MRAEDGNRSSTSSACGMPPFAERSCSSWSGIVRYAPECSSNSSSAPSLDLCRLEWRGEGKGLGEHSLVMRVTVDVHTNKELLLDFGTSHAVGRKRPPGPKGGRARGCFKRQRGAAKSTAKGVTVAVWKSGRQGPSRDTGQSSDVDDACATSSLRSGTESFAHAMSTTRDVGRSRCA